MNETLTQPEQASSHGAWLIITISALLCLGALMVFSAGASLDQQIELDHFWDYATMRRVAFVPIVWIVLALVAKINCARWVVNLDHFWISPLVILAGFSIILLVLVLIPGIGTEVNQSRRWLKFGPGQYGLTFQPSELAKWTIVMFLAAYAALMGPKIRSFHQGFLPACLVLVLTVGLIGKEDFGTAALIGAVGVLVLLVGGVRWWHLLTLMPLAALAFYLLVYCDAHRWARVLAHLYGGDAGSDMPTAYHAQQSIMAIGAGGMWGAGLGRGTVKLGWLPEDTTDFVFAVIGEELGFAGVVLVIGLFIALMVCAMTIVHHARDPLARLLAVAIALMIGAQAGMNLCVVTGLVPTKGIALPFVSAGGSGLIMTAMAAGVLVNIARQNHSSIEH